LNSANAASTSYFFPKKQREGDENCLARTVPKRRLPSGKTRFMSAPSKLRRCVSSKKLDVVCCVWRLKPAPGLVRTANRASVPSIELIAATARTQPATGQRMFDMSRHSNFIATTEIARTLVERISFAAPSQLLCSLQLFRSLLLKNFYWLISY